MTIRVVARQGRRPQFDPRVGVAPEQVLAVTKWDLPSFIDDPVRDSSDARCRRRCRGCKRIPVAVQRPDVMRVSAAVAKRFSELSDEARERRLRHESRRPQTLVKLTLGNGTRASLDQDLQQLERFRREMDRPSIDPLLPLPTVDI
jgi:hypothetical protein